MVKTGQVAFSLGSNVLGIGTDLVEIPQFALLLEAPGSMFGKPGQVFTAREMRRAQERARIKGDSLALHLAAVWAIKEAALKAWVAALNKVGLPLPLREDQVAWAEITVAHSAEGAPQVRFIGEMARVLAEGLAEGLAPKNRAAEHRTSGKHPASTGPPPSAGPPPPGDHLTPDDHPTGSAPWNSGSQSVPGPSSPPTKEALNWHVSASHDGDYALGFVVLSRD